MSGAGGASDGCPVSRGQSPGSLGPQPLLIRGGLLMAVVAYIAGFALSWGVVVWVLLAEIFPNLTELCSV